MSKVSKQKLSIEFVGIHKVVEVAVSTVIPYSGKSFLYLEFMRLDKWRLLVTDDLVKDVAQVRQIDVIRNTDWKGLGISCDFSTQTLELEIYAALNLAPEDSTFQLDKLDSGKWRINHTTDLIPDFRQVAALKFHHG